MEAQLQDLLRHITYTLRHPQANARETVVLVGIAVLLLLASLTFLSLFFVRREKRRPEEVAVPPPRQSPLVDIALLLGAFLIAISVTTGVFLHVSRQPTYCRSCHQMTTDYRSWKRSSHRGVECANCHQAPGAAGYFLYKVNQLDMVLARLSRRYTKPITADVANTSCLQCHEKDVGRSIVVSGLKVRHSDFLAVGYKCVACHNTAGHGSSTVNPTRPSMDQCSTCHDGKKAFSTCGGCHVTDIGRPVGAQTQDYPPVRLGPLKTCRGCHSIAKCNKCHGLELPHPPSWISGLTHAPAGAFDRKELCRRCHSEVFCNGCHRFPGHAPNWKEQHRAHGPLNQEGCLGCHMRTKNLCAVCHKRYRALRVKQPRGRPSEEPEKVPPGTKSF